jgi:CheY-like chemotaxis protein
VSKILVVDDEVVFAKLLTLTFESEGHEVQSAGGGPEAVEKGRSFHPDVLFSDWLLKDGTTGLEVAQALQHENRELKVIFITGLPEQIENPGGTVDIFRVLEKPCGIDVALKAVDDAVNG